MPFSKALAQEFLLGPDLVETTALEAAVCLNSCYNCLSQSLYIGQTMEDNGRRFGLLYCSLERSSANKYRWRVKPKLRLFMHLTRASQGRPAQCWTYRDEDFGGAISKLSRRRRGANTAASTARNTLTRFFSKHQVPLLA